MIKPPILVSTDDVSVFETVEDAERYLEPPEVESGMEVFDSIGQPVRAVIAKKWLGNEIVRFEEIPNAVPRPGELRRHLLTLLSGDSLDTTQLDSMTLAELWTHAARHYSR